MNTFGGCAGVLGSVLLHALENGWQLWITTKKQNCAGWGVLHDCKKLSKSDHFWNNLRVIWCGKHDATIDTIFK